MQNYVPAIVLSSLGALVVGIQLASDAARVFVEEIVSPAQWLLNIDSIRNGLAQLEPNFVVSIAASLIETFVWPSFIAGFFHTTFYLRNLLLGLLFITLLSVTSGVFLGKWDILTILWALLFTLPFLCGAYYLAVGCKRVFWTGLTMRWSGP